MKTIERIKCARIMSINLPLAQKQKKITPEANFDIETKEIPNGSYIIDKKGNFVSEILEKVNGEWIATHHQKLNFTGKINLFTELEGKEYSCTITLDRGSVKLIKAN